MAVFAIMSVWNTGFVAIVSGQDMRDVVISFSLWQRHGVHSCHPTFSIQSVRSSLRYKAPLLVPLKMHDSSHVLWKCMTIVIDECCNAPMMSKAIFTQQSVPMFPDVFVSQGTLLSSNGVQLHLQVTMRVKRSDQKRIRRKWGIILACAVIILWG